MPAATLDFERDVIEASRDAPVLVDFWAPWCQPCKVLGPRLESLAEEAANQEDAAWSLVKVNTDEEPELAQRYNVRGLPTVKLFHDGEVIDEFTGAKPERAPRGPVGRALRHGRLAPARGPERRPRKRRGADHARPRARLRRAPRGRRPVR
ncbi:MAG: hypothetical protein BRD48_06995 [Bacteroidetes bacterium QS_9_68_14]|nr:MAG: hypothetical protein BRD48_06995 [Bacteroidetes bacterium QS_9_68_14]